MLASECRTVSALPLKADSRWTSWLSAKGQSRLNCTATKCGPFEVHTVLNQIRIDHERYIISLEETAFRLLPPILDWNNPVGPVLTPVAF